MLDQREHRKRCADGYRDRKRGYGLSFNCPTINTQMCHSSYEPLMVQLRTTSRVLGRERISYVKSHEKLHCIKSSFNNFFLLIT